MGRTLEDKVFTVRCVCDRCPREHVRESSGDISPPPGWSFLHVSIFGNQHEGALLCPRCLAIVLAAAAPAPLVVD